jgi:hypothetical protein
MIGIELHLQQQMAQEELLEQESHEESLKENHWLTVEETATQISDPRVCSSNCQNLVELVESIVLIVSVVIEFGSGGSCNSKDLFDFE